MEFNNFFRRIRNLAKKMACYPIDRLKLISQKKFSKIYFISDNASWALDRITNSIFNMVKESGFNCGKSINHPRNQIVFYGDQYNLFARNIFKYNNIISFDYEHGLPKFQDINRKLLKLILKNQDQIHLIRVTNSYFKKFIIRQGVNEDKVVQIPPTIDDMFEKFNEKKKNNLKTFFGLPNNKFIIGSFHKDGDGFGSGMKPKYIKGPDILLKTLKLAKANIKNLFVLLTAPARGYVKKGLDDLAIDYKHFENIKYSELPKLYNCLDTYLITSRDEGGPLGMLEAMACGVPVVTTKVGTAFDSIVNGKNGFCAGLDDFQTLAKYIKIIHNDNNLKKIYHLILLYGEIIFIERFFAVG
jgi:glycosyltransferase involved in cell wall biosynthesis